MLDELARTRTTLHDLRLRERIARCAFVISVVEDDVCVAFNHDLWRILGRRSAGTATVREDERGLFYTAIIKPLGRAVSAGGVRGVTADADGAVRVLLQALAEAERIEAVGKTEIYVHEFKIPIPSPLEAGGAIHEPCAACWTVQRVALVVGKFREQRGRA